MILKLIQLVMCLLEEAVLVLWTVELPFTQSISFILKQNGF